MNRCPHHRVQPWIYVAVQFGTILFLLATGRWFSRHPIGLAAQLAGIALVLWAVAHMGLRRLRIQPAADERTQLVTSGPYRLVRHPMYAASLLSIVPMVIQDFSGLRLAALALLVINLILKARYEERLLTVQFPEYARYQQRVKQLVPWVY